MQPERRDLADELLQAKVKSRLFGGDHAPRLGRLVILDKLGAGAMGTVYAAYDPRLDRKVAVKVMHPSDPGGNARVLREARALAKLAHPNIVTIHDAGDDTGSVHVVMELATGVPLRAWIDNPDRTWRDVVRVMADVAAGLAAAHRAGIVHRDIKPENILVGEDRARLVDFGLALEPSLGATTEPDELEHSGKLRVNVTDAEGAATSGRIAAVDSGLAATDLASVGDGGAGTPSYMAPEVLSGEAASAASDQFSFAVTLFEALHGERSHTGTTRAELHAAALHAADATKRGSKPISKTPALPDAAHTPDRQKPSANVTIDQRSQSQRRKDRSKSGQSDTVLSVAEATTSPRRGRSVGAVPAWIDAIVRRGLAARPEDRFPSMEALHDELVRDRTRRRRAIAIAALGLVAGTGIAVAAYRAGGGTTEPPPRISCDGTPRLDVVWNAKTRGTISSGFGGVKWASVTMEGLSKAAADWERSFRTVCEATRVRGEQSDRLLELRMRCLDRALARFDAFVDALQAPLEPKTRIEAAAAVDQLPRASACESLESDPTLDVPTDPAIRTEAASIEAELDRAWASYALGRYTAASTQAIALSQRVSKLELPALHASVLLLGGAIESRIGDGSRARRLLEYAAVHAAKAKAPELELAIWTRMLRQELFGGRADRVVEWGAVGEAAAIRAGREGAEIYGLIGEAQRNTGKLEAARTNLETALQSKDELREDQRAMIEMNLGSVELELGKSATALALHERALERSRRALGEGHPTLAIHLDKLAATARARGRLRDALAYHDQSRALRVAAFGDEDRAVATALFHRAETLLEAGRLEDARKDLQQAREIRVRLFGRESDKLAEIDALSGDVALASSDLGEAKKLYDRARELDPEPAAVYRTVSLVRALGVTPSSTPRGPLDPARYVPAIESLGMNRAKLETWRLVKDVEKLEPFALERAAMIAAQLALLPPDRSKPLVAPFLARYRKAAPVDAPIALAVADAMLAAGDRAVAAEIYTAALAGLADEPSRDRLHALLGLALAQTGDAAKSAAASAKVLAAAMPELR